MITEGYAHVCPERLPDAIQRPPRWAGLPRPVTHRLTRVGPEFFCAQQVMYGTDFPMGRNAGAAWPAEGLRTFKSREVADADRELMLSGNPRRRMPLWCGAAQLSRLQPG